MTGISPKKILAELGFPVSKVSPATRTLTAKPTDTHGWLVEFVGPSGVGKTTLRQQVTPTLRKDWFFEHHAKGLLGQIPEDAMTAAYIKRLFASRLDDLQSLDLPFERIAATSQRVCEVARLGLVTKSHSLPRGFIMDDGLLHFFAGQVLEQERDSTEAFLARTAFIFLLPNEPDTRDTSTPQKRTQLDVYRELLDLVQDIGRPTLVLDSNDRADHTNRVLSFFAKDVLGA
jgi:hypothetical protein